TKIEDTEKEKRDCPFETASSLSFTCAGLKPFELREKETAFNFSVLIRIGSVYCIRLYGFCVFITDCTFIRFSRISCSDECAEVLHRIVFLKDCRNDGS